MPPSSPSRSFAEGRRAAAARVCPKSDARRGSCHTGWWWSCKRDLRPCEPSAWCCQFALWGEYVSEMGHTRYCIWLGCLRKISSIGCLVSLDAKPTPEPKTGVLRNRNQKPKNQYFDLVFGSVWFDLRFSVRKCPAWAKLVHAQGGGQPSCKS